MLKLRVLTALILIPLVLAGIFLLPTDYFSLIVAAILVIASLEWAHIAHINSNIIRILFALVIFLLTYLPDIYHIALQNIILPVSVIWLFVAAWLHMDPVSKIRKLAQQPYWIPFNLLVGAFYLVPAAFALSYLHQVTSYGPAFILFCLLLVWTADIAAYLSGRRWGRRKLAPLISPGKTWEGVYGALVAGAVLSMLGSLLLGYRGQQFIWVSLCGVLTIIMSVYGDLFESVFKRAGDVKDSSHLLPGHGGVLDRIDSLLVAAPVFATCLIIVTEQT